MHRFCRCVLSALLLSGCAERTTIRTAGVRDTGKSVEKSQGEISKQLSQNDGAQLFARDNQPPQPQHGQVFHNADEFRLAAGNPPVVLDFDDVPEGTDLSETDMDGMTLIHVDAPLLVVRADSTYTPDGFRNLADPQTYRLPATSGDKVLSPGGALLAPGPDSAIEDDDLIIVFDEPVAAVGFDFLSQSADGMSFTDIAVIDEGGAILYSGRIDISSLDTSPGVDRSTRFPLPGADFWGFVSDARNIREIRIDETDSDDSCPDSNIGLDTIRFAPAPEPFRGDLNGDGVVDARDLKAWLDQARREGTPAAQAGFWSAADVNRDGLVDNADFALLLDSMANLGF